MAQSTRQRNLFAAEDFKVVYDSFKQANFKSYDYDTIRGAMVDYIQNNYPENYNDWIQSSEFTSLVELIAFLGHNLSFRVDLASRENFLSTAERRASVLRIADFLGYTPSRSVAAQGLLKVTSVKTTQNVFDVTGTSLRNTVTRFEDDQDPSAYQNFLLVMNEVFQSTNRFGKPTASGIVDGVRSETYTANVASDQDIVHGFRASVNGTQQAFEIHSSYIDNELGQSLLESTPTPDGGFNFVYRDDTQGNSSSDTGFFVGFKQGTLQYSDYNADNAISNLAVDVNSARVNNSDVWVQNIDSNGEVQANWTKVDSTYGTSAIFNSITNNKRSLYSVTTLDNDNIAIKFGDGVYADIPRGVIRVWYRTGLNATYTLNPADVGTVSFSFDYVARDGNTYTAGFTATLDTSVNTASSREGVASIKDQAGRVFAAQDRMITAEDYTVYPMLSSENVVKLKSVNRTHSGHSRFYDLNDPTAQYQTVNMIGDDGYIYSENSLDRVTVALPTTLSNTQLFNKHIKGLIQNPEVVNMFYQEYTPTTVSYALTSETYFWQQETSNNSTSTGYFTKGGVIQRTGPSVTTDMSKVQIGSIIEFTDSANNTTWARIVDVYQDGLGVDDDSGQPTGRNINSKGAITLNKVIPNSAKISRIFPAYNTEFSDAEVTEILAQIQNKNEFGLRFDATASRWRIVLGSNLAPATENNPSYFDLATAATSNDNSWLIRVSYSADKWTFLSRRFRIIFGSEKAVRFYNQNNKIKFNEETNKPERDTLVVYSVNPEPAVSVSAGDFVIGREYIIISIGNVEDDTEFTLIGASDNNPGTVFTATGVGSGTGTASYSSQSALGNDVNFYGYKYYTESDGYTNDRKVIATISNVSEDLYPDNPVAFQDLVGILRIGLGTETEDGFDYSVYDSQASSSVDGRASLKFQWKRIADSDQRIDPSVSNVVDLYVLTSSYNTQYREWLSSDRDDDTMPLPPTSEALRTLFKEIENKRAISDKMIYRSARYKSLFGNTADSELQAKFRVVKVRGTTLTNSEVQSRVLEAITEYFSVENWEFGETFYFTELSAHLHNRLAGIISSVVIVPLQENSAFGNLFQVTPETDELFIPDVSLTNVEIVDNLTTTNLRIS